MMTCFQLVSLDYIVEQIQPKYNNRCLTGIYIYIYIKWTVFVNVTTKSAQLAHARMIAIIVKKSPSSSHLYDHGFMDNTNRQAVKIWLNPQTSDASLTSWRQPFWSHPAQIATLQRRYNERDGVSDHRRLDCLLNRLFKCRSTKTSKLRVTGLCEGNSPVTGDFPARTVSNADIPFDDVIMTILNVISGDTRNMFRISVLIFFYI